MKFKEFVNWCNKRACDGCWGLYEANMCIYVINDVRKKLFWNREKYWKEKWEHEICNEIVAPTEAKIAEILLRDDE